MPLNQRNYDTPEIDAKTLDNRMRQNKVSLIGVEVTQSVLLIFFRYSTTPRFPFKSHPKKKDWQT